MKSLKKQFQHQNQENEIQKDSNKKNKKKMTISIRLGKFDFNFFNEISIIQKAIGIDLNKTMIFLMIRFLQHLFDLKDSDLNETSINCEIVKKNFFDHELKKNEIKKSWSINRSKLIDFRIASFGKIINFNLYKEKKEDNFILKVITSVCSSIIQNEKFTNSEASKMIPKLICYFCEEGMKIFYEEKIDDVNNINFY